MNPFIQLLNGFSSVWLPVIIRASIEGALAILLAFILAALCRTGRIKCWWWRLAHLKFLLALLCLSRFALPLLPASSPATIQTAQDMPSFISSPILANPSVPPASALPTADPPIATPMPAPQPRLTLASALMILYFVGVLLCVFGLANQYRRTRALRHRARPIENPSLLAFTIHTAHLLGVCKIPLLLSTQIHIPLLIGIRHPAILLPQSLLASQPPRALELIITHELAHAARRDLLWNALRSLVSTLFFFHPLVWLAEREWLAAQEIACDQLTLQTARSTPADYARTLVETIASSREKRPGLFAVGMGTFANTKRRINAMAHTLAPSRRSLAVSITVVLIGAALGLIPWRVVAQSPPAVQLAQTPTPAVDTAAGSQPATSSMPGATMFNVMGTVTADTVAISSQMDGTPIKINVTEGQHVKAGDVLLQFDPSDAESARDVASVQLNQAKRKLTTLEQEKTVGVVTAEAGEDADAAFSLAQIAVKNARLNLDRTNLIAPIDGIISECDAHLAQFTAKGKPLVTIVNTDKLGITGNLPQAYIDRLHVGQRFDVVVFNTKDHFTGQITFISPVVDSDTATCRFKGSLDPDEKLKAGMTVSIELGSQ